jgi:hypothetical protein
MNVEWSGPTPLVLSTLAWESIRASVSQIYCVVVALTLTDQIPIKGGVFLSLFLHLRHRQGTVTLR